MQQEAYNHKTIEKNGRNIGMNTRPLRLMCGIFQA